MYFTYIPGRSVFETSAGFFIFYLSSTGLVALLTGMRLKLLIERNVRVAGLWIAMREMPGTAEIAAIYPEFGTAFAPTLVGGLLSRCLVVIHDFIRLGTTLGYEVMHNKSVYAAASIRWNAFGNVRSDGIRGMKARGI